MNMKKNTGLSFLLITLSALVLTFAACSNHPSSSAGNVSDTIQHQAGPDTLRQQATQDTVGSTGWSVIVIVNDQTQKPIAGATVSAPCTGWPSKTTNVSGQVQFSGTGSCPCSGASANVTTNKGCNVNTTIVCDGTATAVCP
jgi:hypothetical protein